MLEYFLTIHDETGKRIDDTSDNPMSEAAAAELVHAWSDRVVRLADGFDAIRYVDSEGSALLIRLAAS